MLMTEAEVLDFENKCLKMSLEELRDPEFTSSWADMRRPDGSSVYWDVLSIIQDKELVAKIHKWMEVYNLGYYMRWVIDIESAETDPPYLGSDDHTVYPDPGFRVVTSLGKSFVFDKEGTLRQGASLLRKVKL